MAVEIPQLWPNIQLGSTLGGVRSLLLAFADQAQEPVVGVAGGAEAVAVCCRAGVVAVGSVLGVDPGDHVGATFEGDVHAAGVGEVDEIFIVGVG